MKKVWSRVLGGLILSPPAFLVGYFVYISIKTISKNFIFMSFLKAFEAAIVLLVIYFLLRYMIDVGIALIKGEKVNWRIW